MSTPVKILLFTLVCAFFSCKKTPENHFFELLPSGYTGIGFNNEIVENDSINPLDMEFLYNGGGVATGDFNGDGKPDLYFTGSQVSNALYLNRGDYKFEDITGAAGVGTKGKWCNSAAVVDINNDGKPDIYVCCTNSKNPLVRRNLLYINKGNNSMGLPEFKESAKAYGLADTCYSVSAAFFDADNDGDLDMFLLTTIPTSRNVAAFSGIKDEMPVGLRCKLYQNNFDKELGHPVFKNISQQAGITYDGYGLGLNITDVNQDGWKDICITNDFLTSDVLYINNQNGTFTNKESTYYKHSSGNAMGNDFADINNDGLPDFISVDMSPEDNFRKKKNGNANNYSYYRNMVGMGYMLQYVRNTVQLNQGKRPLQNGQAGDPVFSEVSFLAGVAETDWSWSPLFADFDDDGFKDLLVTNGYPKDITDHDFAVYRNQASAAASKETLLKQIPSIRIPNYAFKNKGNGTFDNVTAKWGMDEPSFSAGAIYVDLDGKGHLDYVVSNINGKAFVYKNRLNNPGNKTAGYLTVRFRGGAGNINGLGTIAELHYSNGKTQVIENSPYRGYLSCVQDGAHFGLGQVSTVDTVKITWPGGQSQLITNVKANQTLTVDIRNAGTSGLTANEQAEPVFEDVTQAVGVDYVHHEAEFIDFNIQKLLPHSLSQYGPGLSVADVDGNGTDDIFVAGSVHSPGVFLMQDTHGKFSQRSISGFDEKYDEMQENRGVLFFDAQGLGRKDLYLTAGSNESEPNSPHYQDRLYLNDGKGNFTLCPAALPANHSSKSCVKAADFNKDGTTDLFIGGRMVTNEYPKPASSILLRNDSKNGICKFTDVTGELAPCLKNIGMVTDALWTDFDDDGWQDLVLVGEFMPVTFIKNDHGRFVNVTAKSGIAGELGCWNSIVAGDFTNSGKIDYVVGNLGLNSFYRASKEHPVCVYGKDFDNNGSFDAIPSLYLKDQQGIYQEFPAFTRDDMIKQMIGFRRKYLNYRDFSEAKMKDVLSGEELRNAVKVSANNMRTSIIRRKPNGTFSMEALPLEAQYAPVFGMIADDFDGDGNLDLALTGNDFGIEVGSGRCDALNGLLLKGNGKGKFEPVPLLKAGLYIPGDGKALVKLKGHNGRYLVAASQNQGALKIFSLQKPAVLIGARPGEIYAVINYKDGRTRKEEFYTGNSFESQSSGFVKADKGVTSVVFTDAGGQLRTVKLL